MKLSNSVNSRTNKSRNKILIFTGLVIITILLIVAYFLYLRQPVTSELLDGTGQQNVVTPAPTALSDTDAEAKKKYVESMPSATSDESNNPTVASASINLSPTLSNSSVIVQTQIKNIDDGACDISISSKQNPTKFYSKTVDVLYQSSYSTCKGFSIPKSEIGNGEWNITVVVESTQSVVARSSTILEVK